MNSNTFFGLINEFVADEVQVEIDENTMGN